jgi:hypothetical protein
VRIAGKRMYLWRAVKAPEWCICTNRPLPTLAMWQSRHLAWTRNPTFHGKLIAEAEGMIIAGRRNSPFPLRD